MERKYYYSKREAAIKYPSQYLSLIIDGMDQGKISLFGCHLSLKSIDKFTFQSLVELSVTLKVERFRAILALFSCPRRLAYSFRTVCPSVSQSVCLSFCPKTLTLSITLSLLHGFTSYLDTTSLRTRPFS